MKSDDVIKFVESLKHTKDPWAGKYFILAEWQKEKIIKPLYGTLNEEGLRQYRTCLAMMGRKNGKTELAAALALYHLFADRETGGEIYSAAIDKDQASLVFDVAAQMVRYNKRLSNISKIIDSQKRIVNYKNHSVYRAIPADAASAHGYNASVVIYDELHAASNRNLFDVLATSMGTRKQPLLLIISTAGYDKKSILWEQYHYAKEIEQGIIKDKTFLPIIFEVKDSEDWEDEGNWKKANPALGSFRKLEEMRSFYIKSKSVPALQNIFRRLYLNQWTSQSTRWLDIAFWDKCDSPLNREKLKGLECWGGLDLASSIDLAALVLVFPRENGFYDVLPFFWIPEEAMHLRSERDDVPYDVWVREGYVMATPGDVIDYKFIEDKIEKLSEIYNIRTIGYDRWGAVQMSQNLDAMGITVVPEGQGYKTMSPPTKELQKLVMSGKIRHGGNPVLRWNFDNVAMKIDPAENIKIDKSKSTERVDGMVALVMGLDGALRVENETSVYEEGGIFTIGGEEPKEAEGEEE